MFSETFLPTYLGYFFGEGISPHRLILVKVFHRGSETVGIKFCHVSNSWLQGVLQRKGSHPPAPRGDESEGASVPCIGTEGAAGVIPLDLISGTRPIRKMEKEINIKTAGVEFKKGMYYPRLIIKLTTAPTCCDVYMR